VLNLRYRTPVGRRRMQEGTRRRTSRGNVCAQSAT
jgi:hypothetical protein